MIVNTFLDKNIYNKKFIRLSDKNPISINNIIFDIGDNVEYDYLSLISCYNFKKALSKTIIIFFNNYMSFDLSNVLDNDRYLNELNILFKNNENNKNILKNIVMTNVFKNDTLIKYIKKYVDFDNNQYESIGILFKQNIIGTIKEIKKYFNISYVF